MFRMSPFGFTVKSRDITGSERISCAQPPAKGNLDSFNRHAVSLVLV